MPQLNEITSRHSIRLADYDYSQTGYYFVTVCTQDRECVFGEVVVGGEMRLNEAGKMVEITWNDLPKRFQNIQLDTFIVMPNHIHGIIIIDRRGEPCVRPKMGPIAGAHMGAPLHRMIQWFKTMTTNEYIRNVKTNKWPPFHGRLWQRNFYEHIIRNERAYNEIQDYIRYNAMKWEEDEYYAA